MSDDCLFCRIARQEIPAKLVHEDPTYVAFRDINPQAPTHLLIIPREHIPTLNDQRPEHQALLGGMLALAARLAEREGIAQSGYRSVINCNADAGQTVPHIHLHLIGGRAMTWPPG